MSNYNNMKALINSFSGQGRMITIPKIYIELTGEYVTAALLNQIVFWSDKSKRRDGFFYKTYKDWEEELALSEYQIRRGINKLKEMKIVDTKLKKAGGSPTIHYKLNYKALQGAILKKLKNGNQRNLRMDTEETQESLTVDYKHKSTTEERDIVEQSSQSDKSDDLPYKEVVDYLNEKADRQFRHTTNKTKRLIRARSNEGFELEDFKKVIDIKVAEWKKDSEMSKYLRPETLFGTKFEGYLNQPVKNAGKERDWSKWEFM